MTRPGDDRPQEAETVRKRADESVRRGEAETAGPLASLEWEAGPALVGALVGLAGLLFLSEPLVGPLAVGNLRVRPVALSAVVFAGALCAGAVVFARRGRRLFALAHGVFGVAWTAIVLGTVLGSGAVLVGGVVLVAAGAGFLVERGRDR